MISDPFIILLTSDTDILEFPRYGLGPRKREDAERIVTKTVTTSLFFNTFKTGISIRNAAKGKVIKRYLFELG